MTDPFTDIVLFRSADWRAPAEDAPLYVHAWAQLLGQCRTALATRRERYPAMVAEGKITADLAARDIAAWEELTAQWTWVVEGPEATGAALPPRQTLIDRIEAVALLLVRVDQQLARGRPSHDLLLQSHLAQALRWHLAAERFAAACPAVEAAKLTRELRAERAQPERKAA